MNHEFFFQNESLLKQNQKFDLTEAAFQKRSYK